MDGISGNPHILKFPDATDWLLADIPPFFENIQRSILVGNNPLREPRIGRDDPLLDTRPPNFINDPYEYGPD